MKTFVLLGALLVGASLPAQHVLPCTTTSTLTVTGTGQAGTVMTFDLQTQRFGLAALGISETQGQYSFGVGAIMIDLGIVPPLSVFDMGWTGADGKVSLDLTVPPGLPPATLHAQAVSVGSVVLTICVSNVVSFNV